MNPVTLELKSIPESTSVTHLRIGGDLDTDCAGRLEDIFDAIIEHHSTYVIAEMSKVTPTNSMFFIPGKTAFIWWNANHWKQKRKLKTIFSINWGHSGDSSV